MFPIYKNDGKSICPLSPIQKKAISLFAKKIESGIYELTDNHCLCGNEQPFLDTVIAEKDRYGIPIQSILCNKCGLIRSGQVLNEQSNFSFYANDYREIYVGSKTTPDDFFEDQKRRGQSLFELFSSHAQIIKTLNIFEIGCGAGGVLFPFSQAGHICAGSDYDENYLAYGNAKSLKLKYGNYQEIIEDESVDVILLSHVMEHFLNPILEMQEIIKKVKPGGWLVLEVPGIFCIHSIYFNPLLYLQNAHVFNYYYGYLKVFFELLGLKTVYGDERITCIIQKPLDWHATDISCIYNCSLSKYPNKIKDYLLKKHLQYILRLNPFQWRADAIRVLDYFGLKESIKSILNR